jgi:sporulation protein YlmC with PRC-barrel domain
MKAHWLMIPTCVLGLSLAAPLQAQQATDAGSRQEQLEKAAQEKAQEARRMAEETKQRAQEAQTLSRQAQQAEHQQQQGQQQQGQHGEGRLNTAGLFRTGDLVGMDVRSRDGQDIGKIEDLTIDAKNGRIAYAVITSGGFLGMGDKLVAVPWNSLQVQTGQGDRANERFLVLNAQSQDFQKAPSFSSNNWPTSQDQIWQVGTEREEMDVNVEQQRQRQQNEQQMREQQQRQQHEQQQREQQAREQQQREQQMQEQQKQEQQKQEQQKQHEQH